MKFTEKLFGTHSERELKRIYPIVDKIEALRPTMQALTDEELRAKTKEYKEEAKPGELVNFNVTLKPYRRENVTVTIPYTIPKNQTLSCLKLPRHS